MLSHTIGTHSEADMHRLVGENFEGDATCFQETEGAVDLIKYGRSFRSNMDMLKQLKGTMAAGKAVSTVQLLEGSIQAELNDLLQMFNKSEQGGKPKQCAAGRKYGEICDLGKDGGLPRSSLGHRS